MNQYGVRQKMNESELEVTAKAIWKAKEAYEKVFEEEEIEGAYYPLLKITVGYSNNDFTGILEKLEYKTNEYGMEND